MKSYPKVKYELTEFKVSDLNFGPDSRIILLWLSIVILGIVLTFLRATKSSDIGSRLYSYRSFINPICRL